jgi:hypothetical protein
MPKRARARGGGGGGGARALAADATPAAAAAAADAPPARPATQWRSPLGCTALRGGAPGEPAFRTWCDANSIAWPKCGIGSSPTTGRCVVATSDIAEGETVVEVTRVWGCLRTGQGAQRGRGGRRPTGTA